MIDLKKYLLTFFMFLVGEYSFPEGPYFACLNVSDTAESKGHEFLLIKENKLVHKLEMQTTRI